MGKNGGMKQIDANRGREEGLSDWQSRIYTTSASSGNPISISNINKNARGHLIGNKFSPHPRVYP
jgi:hypothetical protein